MSRFSFEPLSLLGAYLIQNFFEGDGRGGFTKTFEKDIYEKNGIPFTLNESFVSVSAKNVIRGLHFQLHHPQAKLVSVPHGRVYDVLVDLRTDSPTFTQWQGYELSAENHLALYIPKGFAHGFASLEEGSVVLYQCDGAYDQATDTGVRFDDPDIGVKWPVDADKAIHSARDLQLMSVEEYRSHPMDVSP